ncbi:hypothetical protein [Halopiger aswanensis]|uniref:Dolichyl-phosphate-mannose-protein mannosyltransferase n=1 Tax=Halopiger aswanensis TaxID=148449 RepID=A0A3R7DER4_9EURY|nr:hypothetical protein [Halopiger aswanensis]RKD97352.1 hypothetical protein ATJ93_0338 [Halopiger aswanensis]
MNRTKLDAAFAVGFVAVAVGILVARANPATAYEASLYTATPTATWVGLGIGLAIALPGALGCRGREQGIAIGLGSLAVTAIVSLPVIRNYRFAGMGDALTHLGWTRDIVTGNMAPHELIYPGAHSLAAVVHYIGGVSIERALLFTIVFLFVPFLLFAPLAAREIDNTGLAAGCAAIVAWMVLPINNVATHMGVHTNSNALFLVPVVIFAFVTYLRRRSTVERLPFGLSPFSALVYLTATGLLLVHLQQMVNVVVLVGAIAGVQFLARRRYDDHPILEHPTTYVQTVVLGGMFTVWALANERFRNAVTTLVEGVLSADIGASQEVDQRGTSLTEIGGSIAELFVKMFLDAAVIGLVAGLFVLATWIGWTRTDREASTFVTYFGLGLIPLGIMFALYFVGTPTMAFRQVGFIYVVLTILGGVALAHAIGGLSRYITTPGANVVASVGLGALLVLGLVTVYASPLIYSPTQHVTDEQFSGYESSFEHTAGDQPYVGLGYDPYRYDHGINGLEGQEEAPLSGAAFSSGTVDPEQFEAGNYSGAYRGVDYYLTISAFDETRETDVYRGLDVSEEAVAGVETDPAADKVISNEEYEMYAVASES